jgi:hypothetical protein
LSSSGLHSLLCSIISPCGSGFHPSLVNVLIVWSSIVLGSLVVFAQRWRRRQSGADDLVVDPGYATVTLPMTHGRKQRGPISFREVSAIHVKGHAQRGRRGGVSKSWQVWLSCCNGREERVHDFGDEPSARGFADWLRGLAFPANPKPSYDSTCMEAPRPRLWITWLVECALLSV